MITTHLLNLPCVERRAVLRTTELMVLS